MINSNSIVHRPFSMHKQVNKIQQRSYFHSFHSARDSSEILITSRRKNYENTFKNICGKHILVMNTCHGKMMWLGKDT